MQTDGVDCWYFKLRLSDLTEYIVSNIKGSNLSGCKDKRIRKWAFVAKTQFLCSVGLFSDLLGLKFWSHENRASKNFGSTNILEIQQKKQKKMAFIYLFIYLSNYLYNYLFIYRSIYLSNYLMKTSCSGDVFENGEMFDISNPSIDISTDLSVYLSIDLLIYLIIYLSMKLRSISCEIK